MSMTAEQYQAQLLALCPSGLALPTDSDSVWCQLLHGLAEELARLDARADDLLDEADPRTTLEMLREWEHVCGLPGSCAQEATSIRERRQACALVLAAQGGQSIAYFKELAAVLGVTIAIEEFRPFRAGASVAGSSLTNADWVHTWRTRAPKTTITNFETGGNAAGDPLSKWGNSLFECHLAKYAPAHTILLFAYGDE